MARAAEGKEAAVRVEGVTVAARGKAEKEVVARAAVMAVMVTKEATVAEAMVEAKGAEERGWW